MLAPVSAPRVGANDDKWCICEWSNFGILAVCFFPPFAIRSLNGWLSFSCIFSFVFNFAAKLLVWCAQNSIFIGVDGGLLARPPTRRLIIHSDAHSMLISISMNFRTRAVACVCLSVTSMNRTHSQSVRRKQLHGSRTRWALRTYQHCWSAANDKVEVTHFIISRIENGIATDVWKKASHCINENGFPFLCET